MAHKLSKSHKEMCQRIKKYKADNKENKEEFYLILEHPTLELILKADVTPSSKILLVYLLSRVHFDYKHLYVYLPYKLLEEHTGIKKPTAISSLKDLNEKNYIKLHSGQKRVHNNEIKEFLFQQKQFYDPRNNQQNIIEMTPFFAKILKAQK